MATVDAKRAKATTHLTASGAALAAIAQAIADGRPVLLQDAKVLEAAGCWLRRNMTESD
jgi:hypothetical protein